MYLFGLPRKASSTVTVPVAKKHVSPERHLTCLAEAGSKELLAQPGLDLPVKSLLSVAKFSHW